MLVVGDGDGDGEATNIDDLEPLLQQRLGLVREVIPHSIYRRRVRLVNVHAPDRAADGGVWIARLLAADCVVEDEDPGSPRSECRESWLSACPFPERYKLAGVLMRHCSA